MHNNLKVLLVCGEQPFPANNGMRIPTWNMIKFFPENWMLSLYCFDLDDQYELENSINNFRLVRIFKGGVKNKKTKSSFLNKVVKFFCFLFSNKPSFSIEHPSKIISHDLKNIFKSEVFDVVILDAEFLAIYASEIPVKSYKVISPNDSITLSWKNEIKYNIFKNPLINLYTHINIRRAYRYEAKYYNYFDLCHFVSKIDADFVSKFVSREKLLVVSNGVDGLDKDLIIPPSINSNKVIIVGALVGGNLSYTLRFIDEVWIKVIKHKPEMELTIVSRVNPKKIQKYLKKYNIKISNYSGNLALFYQNFGLVVSPVLKDCGILNKVLEGMASGRVVIGYKCSFFGIPEAVNFKEVLSANSSREMVKLIITASSKGKELDAIGERSTILATKEYSWNDKILSLADVIQHNVHIKKHS